MTIDLSSLSGSGNLLDDILARLGAMTPAEKAEISKAAYAATQNLIWIPNPGPQTEAYHCVADILLYGGQGGGGKALKIDTPLPTPYGWTSMGEVRVGDELFDETGAVCRVVAATPVMHGRPCYRVEFSDGSEVVADAEHGWHTLTAKERDGGLTKTDEWRAARRAKRPSRAKEVSKKPWVSRSITQINKERVHTYKAPPTGAVRTTAEIAGSLMVGTRRGGHNHSVRVAGALECPEQSLLIDPYLLGLWLGDGTTARAEITTADREVVEAIAAGGFTVISRAAYTKYGYGINGGFLVQLRQLGVLGNKHIPAAYLRASKEQRLALLQGLMDTDGYGDKSGQCDFTSTKRALVDGVAELLATLGIKAHVREGVAKLNGRVIGPKYSLKFMTEKPAFRLARKLIRQKRGGFRGTHARRYIVSATPIDSVPVRCIEVDSPSHQYLCGRAMIPTHNSDLGLGLAFTQHKRSLILRRQYANLSALTERAVEINGSRNGFSGSPPPLLRTADGRYIQFGANQHPGDETAWQGHAYDYKFFDEASAFLEQQIRFHMGWLRSVDPNQRVRAVLGSNPPLGAEGDWLIGMFRPWLDLTHPKPAKSGELRWFVTAPDGKDLEVPDRTPVELEGRKLIPLSRTFIPAAVRDNPFLVRTDYQSKLDALPEPLRSAVRDGNFMAVRADAEWQVIPTAWVIAAEQRWKTDGHKPFTMTAMAFDPAGGGKDEAALAWRYGGWYAPIVTRQGDDTADGSVSAAFIFRHRQNNSCGVVVDVGGGYGGSVTMRLKDNGISHIPFNGAERSNRKTKDGQLAFRNKRAEAWWRFREELNPDQEGGSQVALPPDPELRADLTAPTYEVTAGGILIESKDSLRKRLGRSPGKGDAVVMCMSEGNAAVHRIARETAKRPSSYTTGYAHMKNRGSRRQKPTQTTTRW